MQALKGFVSPVVWELMQKTGVTFYTRKQVEAKLGDKTLPWHCATYYNTKDFIMICPVSILAHGMNIDKVVLHELAHWTGHPSRLNRESIAFGIANAGRMLSNDEYSRYQNLYATEELTAEGAAFELYGLLGLDQKRIERECASYGLHYRNGNMHLGTDLAFKAVEYLINYETPEVKLADFLQSSMFMK